MIRKLIIFVLIIVGIYHLSNHLITTGKFDKFLDDHPNPNWVPVLEYYIGEFHAVFAKWDKAVYRFKRTVKKYPETKYGPSAQYALAKVYDDKGDRKSAIKEYERLLKLFPKCKYTEISRKRVSYLR